MKSLQELASMARKHWKEWRPQRTRELKARGEFEAATQAAAVRAQKEMRKLMDQGYQQHEAEEVVLRQQILLNPEPEEPDEEEQAAERAYQAQRAEELRQEEAWALEDDIQDELADRMQK